MSDFAHKQCNKGRIIRKVMGAGWRFVVRTFSPCFTQFFTLFFRLWAVSPLLWNPTGTKAKKSGRGQCLPLVGRARFFFFFRARWISQKKRDCSQSAGFNNLTVYDMQWSSSCSFFFFDKKASVSCFADRTYVLACLDWMWNPILVGGFELLMVRKY